MSRLTKFMPAFCSLLVVMCAASPSPGQTGSSPNTAGRSQLPVIRLNDRAAELQGSLYPDFYSSHSSREDARWVAANDSALAAFWSIYGDTTLNLLSELSGLPWIEKSFEIYLVRYYPSIGAADPLIIPVGGIREGGLAIAAPSGKRLELNLVFQLARRMLDQSTQPEAGYYHPMAEHPLMQVGPYRRDILAMLLALVTAENVMGLDSAYAAYQSAFWQQNFPGREIFEQYVFKKWILSAEKPLTQWVLAEPRTSKLAEATRPPRRPQGYQIPAPPKYIEGLPLSGRLGFSVSYDSGNRLVVDRIDAARLAYANGLRQSDLIRQVNNQRVRSQKDLIEKILATLDRGGATIQITRNGENMTLILRPIDLASPADELYWDDNEYLYDSLPSDSAGKGSGGLGPDQP